MPLNRDQILGNIAINTKLVAVPRWGGEVLVREMPMASPRYVAFVNSHQDKRFVVNTPQGPQIMAQEHSIRRHLGAAIMCTLDPETEQPMFKWADADELREKHWNTVLAIATTAYELAGGDGPEDLRALEAVDVLINYAIEGEWSSDDVALLAGIRSRIKVTEPPVDAEIVSEDQEEAPGRPLAVVKETAETPPEVG